MKMIKVIWDSQKRAYIYTILFTSVILFFLILKLELYPFGDHDLIYWDSHQYFGFAGYLQNTFFSKSNLLYSWSKVLGDGMLSTYAYYASSPFNFLLIFFNSNLLLGVSFIAALKVYLTAINFCVLLNDSYKTHYFAKGLFSVSYAFIGYITFFAWNASWMDGVLLLPLLLLGMKKMIIHKKPWLYIFSLAFGVFSNFYIGYMLCFTTMIFYCIYLVEKKGEFFCRLRSSIARYIMYSMLSVGLTACLIIPTFFALPSERKVSIAEICKSLCFNFKSIDFLPMFYTGSLKHEDALSNMPVIFVGIVAFALVITFFINKDICIRKKTIMGLVCLSMFFSFQLSTVNIIWHGVSNNVGFNYRYSFIFSFILLIIAFDSYVNFPFDSATIYKGSILFLIITALAFYQDRPNFSVYSIMADIFVGVFSLVLIWNIFFEKKYKRNVIQIILAVLVLGNMFMNSYSFMHEGVETTSASEYMNAKKIFEEKMTFVEEQDFYRIGNLKTFGGCDASLFNYAGVGDFASTENIDILKLTKRFGLEHTWMWSQYNVNTPESADNLLGFRYIISPEKLRNKDYELVSDDNDLFLYKNNNALPLIYTAEVPVNLDTSYLNSFQLHNSYWKAINGSNTDVFDDAVISSTVTNTEVGEDITLNIKAETSGRLYLQVPSGSQIQFEVNKILGIPEFSSYQDLYFLGDIQKGDIKEVKIHVTGTIDTNGLFAAIEDNVLQKIYAKNVIENSPIVYEVSSSKLQFTSEIERDQFYMTSIPYDSQWKLFDNGEKIQIQNSGGFLSFSLKSGCHDVQLKYIPKGLILGIFVSCVSLIVILILMVFCIYKNKEKR